MQPGEIDARTVVGDVHRVAPVGGPAISVHVYAEPLDTCLVFDVEQNTCRSAVNRYDRSPIGMPAAR
jgi:cysteine dioxygenase